FLLFRIKISPDAIKTFFEKKQRERLERKEREEQERAMAAMQVENTEDEEMLASTAHSLSEDTEGDDDDELDKIELKTIPASQFEINKESLKPTIEHPSEISLNPAMKPKQ